MRIFLLCFLTTYLLLQGCTSFTDQQALVCVLQGCPKPSADRFALVIGNDDYQGTNLDSLPSVAKDADDMATTLRQLGFRVDLRKNLTKGEMEDAIRKFKGNLGEKVIGLFYFSGHGVKDKKQDESYLVPVRIKAISSQTNVQEELVSRSTIYAALKEAKNPGNIVILDACRDSGGEKGKSLAMLKGPNEVVHVDAGATSGKVQDIPDHTIVAFATQQDNTAGAGEAGNTSIYTGWLLKFISRPGLSILEVFEDVNRTAQGTDQLPTVRLGEDPNRFFDLQLAGQGDRGTDKGW